MDKQTFTLLLEKYLAGKASKAETKLLEAYYDALLQQDKAALPQDADEDLRKEMLSAILSRVQQTPASPAPAVTRIIPFRRIAAAAILLFAIGGIVLFRLSNKKIQATGAPVVAHAVTKPIIHGTDKAILTLGNGEKLELDSAGNGTLASLGNNTIIKSGAHLLYQAKNNHEEAVTYNTLSTPKGGQYHVTLSDGTAVWLNASSSIRYPTAFNGKERNVEITGEAYFEVAKDPAHPFHVQVNNMTVEVLGTHFNVTAYSDEVSINTTLVEGSVKVKSGTASGMLVPGQQSIFNKAAQSITVGNADTEKALAWMNGLLIFKRDDIRTIMRQLSRWYDVDISYGASIPSKLYSGTISKYADISEVLRILELGGIRFKIDGNKITVL